MKLVEPAAALAGLAYVLLILRRDRRGWIASALSSGAYVLLFAGARLPMQSLLNAFYVVMAAYGWISWTRNAADEGGVIRRWPWQRHVLAVLIVLGTGLLCAQVLASETRAAWPRIDSLVAMACLVASFLTARSVLENWPYWIVADSFSVFMFLNQAMYYTAALYTAYIVIAIFGWREWARRWRGQNPGA